MKATKAKAAKTATESQVRVLVSIHLQGHTGPMGSLNLAQRRKFLKELVGNGWLTDKMQLTAAGINVSGPNN